MTPNQKRTHWQLWQAACKANAWRFQGKRLLADGVTLTGDYAHRVYELALATASHLHRPILDDDLRHSLYWLATQSGDLAQLTPRHLTMAAAEWISMGLPSLTDLDTKSDTDRVFAWLKILANPNDLAAVIVLENPEQKDRERLIARIKELADPAYLRQILLDQGDPTTRLQDLTTRRLQQIVYTLSARSRSAARRGTSISHRTAGFQPAVSQASSLPPKSRRAQHPCAASPLALPKLPAQNAAEPISPAQSPSGAPGTAAGAISPTVNQVHSHEPDDNCPF